MDEDYTHKLSNIPPQYVMRYYRDEFPAEGDLVMGESEKSEENGCYVALLEYNNKQGMMPINEYTTAMRRNYHRAMKVGRREILRVIRVDREKGYIDLSKKKLNAEDEVKGAQKFASSTLLHSILIHVAETCKIPILELYETTIWPLYGKGQDSEHPLVFLKQAVINQEKSQTLVFQNEEIKKVLFEELKRRFKRPIVKTMANFSASVRSFQGINAIKRALQTGIQASKEKGFDVKIFIIGAPKYTCQVSSTTIQAGKEALSIALAEIEKAFLQQKGEYTTDKQPYTVGDTNAHIKQMIKQQKGQQGEMVIDEDDADMGDA